MGELSAIIYGTELKIAKGLPSTHQNGYTPSSTLEVPVPASLAYQNPQRQQPPFSFETPSSSRNRYTTSERLDIPTSANLAQPLTTESVAQQPAAESQISQAGLEEPLELIVNGRRMYACPYHCNDYPLQERSFNVRQHVGAKHRLPNAPAKL